MKQKYLSTTEKSLTPTEKQVWIMPKDFNEITLTPEEEAYALYDARCEKYYVEKERKEKARKAQELLDCVTPFSATELKEYVLKNNPTYLVDNENENLFTLLCQYFTNDPAFEKTGYSLTKGLLICGGVGVGKTEILKLFSKNKRQCFHLVSVLEIEANCQKQGVTYLSNFNTMVPGWGNTPDFFYQKAVGWAIDDIGRENMVFDFGNKSDVISKIIQTRYANKHKVAFSSLHLTTNLTAAEIESRYDYAIKSRLREMFNYIVLEGVDRRR